MSYFKRAEVMELLGVSRRESYRICPPVFGKFATSQSICAALNESRRAGQQSVRDDKTALVPRILTAEAASELTGLPADFLVRRANASRNPCPHWRLAPRVIRFHLPSLSGWIERNTNKKRK